MNAIEDVSIEVGHWGGKLSTQHVHMGALFLLKM